MHICIGNQRSWALILKSLLSQLRAEHEQLPWMKIWWLHSATQTTQQIEQYHITSTQITQSAVVSCLPASFTITSRVCNKINKDVTFELDAALNPTWNLHKAWRRNRQADNKNTSFVLQWTSSVCLFFFLTSTTGISAHMKLMIIFGEPPTNWNAAYFCLKHWEPLVVEAEKDSGHSESKNTPNIHSGKAQPNCCSVGIQLFLTV